MNSIAREEIIFALAWDDAKAGRSATAYPKIEGAKCDAGLLLLSTRELVMQLLRQAYGDGTIPAVPAAGGALVLFGLLCGRPIGTLLSRLTLVAQLGRFSSWTIGEEMRRSDKRLCVSVLVRGRHTPQGV